MEAFRANRASNSLSSHGIPERMYTLWRTSGPDCLTSEKPRIIVEINDNTGFIPSFLSESN